MTGSKPVTDVSHNVNAFLKAGVEHPVPSERIIPRSILALFQQGLLTQEIDEGRWSDDLPARLPRERRASQRVAKRRKRGLRGGRSLRAKARRSLPSRERSARLGSGERSRPHPAEPLAGAPAGAQTPAWRGAT